MEYDLHIKITHSNGKATYKKVTYYTGSIASTSLPSASLVRSMGNNLYQLDILDGGVVLEYHLKRRGWFQKLLSFITGD